MSFPNIFTVSSGELGALSPESAVNLFRELLWAEAAALGIGKHQINVPSAITVTDGGIDAEVEGALVPVGRGQGLIRPGLTRYQIKTGNFSIGERNYVDRILFTPSSLRKGAQRKLQPRVQSCLDRDGTLVVVLFGWDKPEIKDGQIVGVFADAVAPQGTVVARLDQQGPVRLPCNAPVTPSAPAQRPCSLAAGAPFVTSAHRLQGSGSRPPAAEVVVHGPCCLTTVPWGATL